MKPIVVLTATLAVKCVFAWGTIGEMELDVCKALTNDNFLVSAAFTNQLNSATNVISVEMKSEAYLLLSINAYQNFLNTADDGWLCCEMFSASNAVDSIGIHSNKWQYWMARFTYASAQISEQRFFDSFSTLTNALDEILKVGYTNANSDVERAMLRKYEMPDLNIADAMKVFAGMTASELGMGNVATNYANQLPVLYRNKILEFIR